MIKFKKVGIISFDYDPSVGGQGIYVKNLTNNLELNAIKYFVISSAKNNIKEHLHIPRFKLGNFGPLFFSIIVNLFITRWIKHYKLGMIHLQAGAGGVFIFRSLPIPIVTTSHMLYSAKRLQHKNPVYRILFILEKRTFHNSNIIIATSDLMKEQIIKDYEVNSKKIIVAYPGINFSVFKAHSTAHNKNEYLFVGRLEPSKQVVELINIFLKINTPTNSGNFKLTLIGEGSQKKLIKSIIKKNNASTFIRLLPALKSNNLPKYYSEACCLILPSKYEALGIAAIEALACCTPVIVPKNSGLSHLVERYNWGSSFSNLIDLEKLILADEIKNKKIDRHILANYFDEKLNDKRIINVYTQLGLEHR
jgi:glycosyltransferase involved in cell wall biosynthesis